MLVLLNNETAAKLFPRLILKELSSIRMQTFSFVSVKKHGSLSREWKPAIGSLIKQTRRREEHLLI